MVESVALRRFRATQARPGRLVGREPSRRSAATSTALAAAKGRNDISFVNQTNEAVADEQARRDSLTSLEKERERETRFIRDYMALNGCTEAAARAVYMQLFSQRQRTATS